MLTLLPTWMPENKIKLIKFFITIGFAMVIAGALIMGCGKKAPPFAPYFIELPAVTNLEYKIIEEKKLKLSWLIPMKNGQITPGLDGFRVYRSKLSLADCQKCPLRFELAEDIAIDMVLVSKSKKKPRMQYIENLEMGYNYVYKIETYGKGAKGKDSKKISFNF